MKRFMTSIQLGHMYRVLQEVVSERYRQHAKWGEQNYPDGTGELADEEVAQRAKKVVDRAARDGCLTYRLIAEEEIAEAFAESDPAKLREELVQTAAVLVAWIETIDRRADLDGDLSPFDPLASRKEPVE